MVYPTLLPLMRTPWLPVVDWNDDPANLDGLVRFAERRNLVSARVPSHFKRSILPCVYSNWYMSWVYVDWLLSTAMSIMRTVNWNSWYRTPYPYQVQDVIEFIYGSRWLTGLFPQLLSYHTGRKGKQKQEITCVVHLSAKHIIMQCLGSRTQWLPVKAPFAYCFSPHTVRKKKKLRNCVEHDHYS